MERKYQSSLGYFVFGGITLIMAYHLLSGDYHLWLSPPPVINLSINYTYWLFAGSGLLGLISTAVFYYFFLATVPMMILMHRHRQAVWIFSALLGVYIMTFNILSGHHYHTMVGAFALTIPFWFKREKSFNLAFAGVRYYACFILASAALWKIWRGSAFHHGHFANLIKAEHTSYLTQEPGTLTSHIMYFIIAHPWVGDVLWGFVILTQLAFAAGFFTKRFDLALLILLCVFIVANKIFFDLASWEMLILGICFLPQRWLVVRPKADAAVSITHGLRTSNLEL
jgi:hypothetical protein